MESGKRYSCRSLQSLGLWTLSSFLLATTAVFDARAGDLEITFTAGVTETFTDNVDLDPDGQKESAILSDFVGSFSLRNTSARVNGGYDGTATLRHQTGGDDEGVSLLPRLSGFGNIEAFEDHVFIDTSSSISQQVLDTSQSDTESNRETTQTHRVSPYLVNRFGDFASSELRYTYDATIIDGDDSAASNTVSDTTTQTVSLGLDSGADFNMFRWSFNANASESDRSNSTDINRWSASFSPEYAVDRSFSLIGSIGYESFEQERNARSTADDDFDGVTWDAGFRWRPGRRTDFSITYGRRDDDDSLEADFSFQVSSRTRITSSYRETLETGSERLSANLAGIGLDPDTGQLIDPNTGLPFDGSTGPTSLVDTTTRNKTFRAAVVADRGRNTFNFSTVYREQKEETSGVTSSEDETGFTVSGSWSRRLDRQTTLLLDGSIDSTDFDAQDRVDTEYSVGTRLNYSVFENINAFVDYNFRLQESDLDSQEHTENRISVGARGTF